MSCSRAGCQESAERSITDSTTIWHILLSLTWYIFLTKFLIHHFCVKEGWWSPSYLSFFFHLFFISWRLITLQYCSGFCHTLTWISHGFTCISHPDPPPTSLSTKFLWVFPVHQVQALVSCIQPGLVICFTLDNIHVLMLEWKHRSKPRLKNQELKCTLSVSKPPTF